MKQARIIELLQEMASSDGHRKAEIVAQLIQELPEDAPGEGGARPDREDLHRDTMQCLLTSLVYRAPKDRLVSLAPFITLMCGERSPNTWTADIDWANLPAS